MKALVLTEYKHFELQDLPRPKPGPSDVLVKVQAVGICGSDVHGMDGSSGRRIPPVVMGHEASGIVVETGDNVRNWHIGDRVTFDSTVYSLDDWYSRRGMYNLSDGREVLGVSTPDFRRQGAFAEFIVVPQHILYLIPDNVSFTQAALVEPVAVALARFEPDAHSGERYGCGRWCRHDRFVRHSGAQTGGLWYNHRR
jgi:L-iditol 2-dehydrogenase